MITPHVLLKIGKTGASKVKKTNTNLSNHHKGSTPPGVHRSIKVRGRR